MKIIIEPNYEEYSKRAADIIISTILQDGYTNLSLTLGDSPKGIYKILIDYFKKNRKILNKVEFFNFDEAYYDGVEEGEGLRFLREDFYDLANVDLNKVHTIKDKKCREYDDEVAKAGGIDLMLFGMGGDGHFATNMPYVSNLLASTYQIEYGEEYPWYKDMVAIYGEGNLPPRMYTMGAASLMKVKHLLLIVNGKRKAKTFRKFLESDITNEFPISVLKLHPNLTIILDRDAASESLDLI